MSESTGDSAEKDKEGAENSALERLFQAAIESNALGDDVDPSTSDKFASIILSEAYKGPFQHPEFLRKFNEVVENGAERAFSLTEREQRHRHENDNKIIDAQIRQIDADVQDRRLVIKLGYVFAFTTLLAFIVLVVLGKNVPAIVTGATSLISAMGTAFFARKKGAGGGA